MECCQMFKMLNVTCSGVSIRSYSEYIWHLIQTPLAIINIVVSG